MQSLTLQLQAIDSDGGLRRLDCFCKTSTEYTIIFLQAASERNTGNSPHRTSRRRPFDNPSTSSGQRLRDRLGFCDSPSRGE